MTWQRKHFGARGAIAWRNDTHLRGILLRGLGQAEEGRATMREALMRVAVESQDATLRVAIPPDLLTRASRGKGENPLAAFRAAATGLGLAWGGVNRSNEEAPPKPPETPPLDFDMEEAREAILAGRVLRAD